MIALFCQSVMLVLIHEPYYIIDLFDLFVCLSVMLALIPGEVFME